MKAKHGRRYLVRLSCIGTQLRTRRIVFARSSDTAHGKVQGEFFKAHPEIVERGLSVGGSVERA